MDAGLAANLMNDEHGRTFYDACAEADVTLVREILASDGKTLLSWKRPGMGWTPLHVAVEMGHADVVRILIAAGAPIEARNHQGWTPLCLAVDAAIDGAHQSGEPLELEIIGILLEAGAEADSPGQEDASPLALARRYGCTPVEDLLVRRP